MLANSFLDKALDLQCGNKFSSTLLMAKNDNSNKCIIAQINKLLPKSSSRIDGLQLLNECLSKFSPQIICEHGPGWITHCLNHHEKDQNTEAYLKTLANIITNSQNHSEFNKKFVSDFLTPTLDMALKVSGNINVKEASLKCLASCLENYASSCNFFKARIEDYALSFFETSSDKLNLASGLVFFYCQQIGNAGADGCNYVSNITLSIRRLCVTCHKLLDSILEGQIEYENYESNDIEPMNIKPAPIHHSEHLKLHNKIQCLKNTINWILILLRKSSTKTIYPQEIISIIQRGVSSHSCLEQELSSFETAHFSYHFIAIQIEVLKLLAIVIRQMGVMLFPFYHTISKIILDAIMRSHSCSCYIKNSLLQEYLYDAFKVWLRLGGTELDQSMQDKLVNFFVKQVFLNASEVGLKLDTDLIDKSLKVSKSQQKKILNKPNECSLSVHSLEYKSNVHFSALNTLHILFKYTHVCLSESILDNLYSFLIKSILSVQNGQAIFPFNEKKCQLVIYKIFCSIFEQNYLRILPPLQMIINILRKGTEHYDEEISGTCLDGLKNLEKLCQPVLKSLYTSDNKKYSNKCESITYRVKPKDIADNRHVSIQTSGECCIRKDSEVKILYNQVIVPPVQEFDSEGNTGLEENEISNGEKFCESREEIISMEISSTEDNAKSSTENVEEFQEVAFTKKRKLEHNSDDDVTVNCFVDVVNCDYE